MAKAKTSGKKGSDKGRKDKAKGKAKLAAASAADAAAEVAETAAAAAKGPKTLTRYRDAGNGRFVSKTYAKRHPKSTVREAR